MDVKPNLSPSDFGQTGKLLGGANRRDIRLSNPLESLAVSGGSGSHGTAPNVTSGEAGPSNKANVSGAMRLQYPDTPLLPISRITPSPMSPIDLSFGAITTGTAMGHAPHTSDAYIQLYQQCEQQLMQIRHEKQWLVYAPWLI